MKINSILVATTVLASGSACASDNYANYDYIEAGYAKFEQNEFYDLPEDLSGFKIAASKRLGHFFIAAQYLQTKDDQQATISEYDYPYSYELHGDLDYELTEARITAGVIVDITDSQSIDFSLSYVDSELEGTFTAHKATMLYPRYEEFTIDPISESETADADIYRFETRYVARFNDFNFKAIAGAERIDVDYDDDTSFIYGGELGYSVTDAFSVNISYNNYDYYEISGVNIRYHF
ncbi:hypothetical protein [Salinimonas lutimaris]|uniref:hypothetical protein n=1 Tax=Salinimonas lutimaris TaxID=914153 RepID=UPI0010BFE20F|nr:hypothetical protein [Salinimonas lutimaris]